MRKSKINAVGFCPYFEIFTKEDSKQELFALFYTKNI